jgi:Na+-driven multidrug efflux pump
MSLLAAVLALLPGFIFPFVLPIAVGPGNSDTYLLGVSVAMTLTNVFSNAIELHAVAAFGRHLGAGSTVSAVVRQRYTKGVVKFAAIGTVIVAPCLAVAYFVTAHDPTTFLVISLTVFWVPVLAAFTSVSSGRLIASGRTVLPVAMQAPRAALPLIVILTVPQPPLLLLAASFACAEVIRCIVLKSAAKKLTTTSVEVDLPLSVRGLAWQSGSAAVAQGGPVTDRVFLSSTIGAITAYELADKVFFAAVQFMSLGLLVRKVGVWAQLFGTDRLRLTARYKRDVRLLVTFASAMAVVGVALVTVVTTAAIAPEGWQRGLWWAAILIMSLPFTVTNMAATRIIVIAGRQSILAWMSILTLVGNAALDAMFYLILGVDGIPIATVILRIVATCVYVQLVKRLLRSIIAET